MNRCRASIVAVSLAVCLLGCWLLALPGEASAERFDIVVGGKLTDDARITGTTKPEGDREDDGAFVFSGLHNFVCAGAGFTSPDARIVAKLSIDKFDAANYFGDELMSDYEAGSKQNIHNGNCCRYSHL